MRHVCHLPAVLVVAFTTLVVGHADAQPPLSQITVTGVGTAKALPDVVEMSGYVSGVAELAGDAVTKFRTVKDDAVAALNGLAIEGLTVEPSGFTVGPSATEEAGFFGGLQEMEQAPPQVSVRERLVIRLTGIDTLEPAALLDTVIKVIDAGKEAGISFSGNEENYAYVYGNYSTSFVTFKLADPKRLRQAAMKDALTNARQTAGEIAELAQGKLGAIRDVHESQYELAYEVYDGAGVVEPGTAANHGEIELSVSLTVQFAFEAGGN